MPLADRLHLLRTSIPDHVQVVAAAKTRTPDEIRAAIDHGVTLIGHNYVQEAQAMIEQLGRDAASWTLIGHLQRNKVKAAVALFDSIQTIDSLRLAEAVNRECERVGRVMPILIEVNAAREPQKSGVAPEAVGRLVEQIADLSALSIQGLMTMGPLTADPEDLRPLYRDVKSLFDQLRDLATPGVAMDTLSMGMSGSYRLAIEEGATMVRVGTLLFGARG